MKSGGSLSIWFFIGLSLLVNGVLIFASGIYELSHPPSYVLHELHASIWWGAVLSLTGAFYCVRFAPSRVRADQK
jgi:hypothetical protein